MLFKFEGDTFKPAKSRIRKVDCSGEELLERPTEEVEHHGHRYDRPGLVKGRERTG